MKPLPILVVEDDLDLLEAICATMQLAGYQTLAASNGDDAMTFLQGCPIGMVVSDVQMNRWIDAFERNQSIQSRTSRFIDDCLSRSR